MYDLCVCSTETKVSHAFTTKQAKKNPRIIVFVHTIQFFHTVYTREMKLWHFDELPLKFYPGIVLISSRPWNRLF